VRSKRARRRKPATTVGPRALVEGLDEAIERLRRADRTQALQAAPAILGDVRSEQALRDGDAVSRVK
jgi:hypothetical protein